MKPIHYIWVDHSISLRDRNKELIDEIYSKILSHASQSGETRVIILCPYFNDYRNENNVISTSFLDYFDYNSGNPYCFHMFIISYVLSLIPSLINVIHKIDNPYTGQKKIDYDIKIKKYMNHARNKYNNQYNYVHNKFKSLSESETIIKLCQVFTVNKGKIIESYGQLLNKLNKIKHNANFNINNKNMYISLLDILVSLNDMINEEYSTSLFDYKKYNISSYIDRYKNIDSSFNNIDSLNKFIISEEQLLMELIMNIKKNALINIKIQNMNSVVYYISSEYDFDIYKELKFINFKYCAGEQYHIKNAEDIEKIDKFKVSKIIS